MVVAKGEGVWYHGNEVREMVVYAIVMFATAALFAVLAVLIYRGKTDLIHDYHQTKVKDRVAYGKAFGKALAVFPATMALSGAVSLLGEAPLIIGVAVGILITGFAVGMGLILGVQKKHNGGLF